MGNLPRPTLSPSLSGIRPTMNRETTTRVDSSTPAARLGMRVPSTSRAALVGVAALVVILGGWYGIKRWRAHVASEGQYIFAAIQKGDIEDLVTATGSLQPRDYVDVGAQVSGQLDKILVEVGSDVKEGDLLAEIDADVAAARVDASRAQLRSQQAQLVQQQANLTKAERDLTRQQNLMKEDATTAEQVQNAETTLDTTKAQINALKAQMEQLRASMRVDESNLNYTKILAPMSGTVVSISAKQGQTLNTNQQAPTILRIADLSTMTVQTQVSEADVSKLRSGMQAYFTTLGSAGKRWYGQLKKIEPTPTVTNNVVLYNALFEVPNDNKQLLPQMTAQVFFVAAAAHDVLVVPMSAVSLQRTPPGGIPNAAAAQAAGARGAGAQGAGAQGAQGASAQGAGAQSGQGGQGAAALTPEQIARREARRQQRMQSNGGSATGGAIEGGPPRGGFGASMAARGPRHATVRVQAADGKIEERQITIGVTNRVHAEVLSGLKEGERVVAGTKEPEKAPATAGGQQGAGGQRNNIGGFPGGGLGGGFGR
uniref:Macrolide-specific efflux protein MacA n=1 Tax=uncultured bacterium BLR8 TaxID=506524 RepID=C0IN90_9BACT|nr:macrolide-specific efflux protein MacA [uncultured bacterium BLR8]